MYFKNAAVKATLAAKVLWKLIDSTCKYKWRKTIMKRRRGHIKSLNAEAEELVMY